MRVCWRASGRATGVLLNGRVRGLAGGWTYGRAITSRQAHVRVIEWTVRQTDEQAGGRATARTGRHACTVVFDTDGSGNGHGHAQGIRHKSGNILPEPDPEPDFKKLPDFGRSRSRIPVQL